MSEAAVAAPPQLSPDGQWWWTGAEWVPAHSAADAELGSGSDTAGAMSTSPAHGEDDPADVAASQVASAYASSSYAMQDHDVQAYAGQGFAGQGFAEQAYDEPAYDEGYPQQPGLGSYEPPVQLAKHAPVGEPAAAPAVAWVPAQADGQAYAGHVVDPTAALAQVAAPQHDAPGEPFADQVPDEVPGEHPVDGAWSPTAAEPYVPPRATMDVLAKGGARRTSAGGAPKPLLLVGGIVLLAALAGGGYYLTQGSSTGDSTPVTVPVRHVAAAPAVPAAPAAKAPAGPAGKAPAAPAAKVPALTGPAADAATKSDIRNLATSMETYATDRNGVYTSNLATLGAQLKTPVTFTTGSQLVLHLVGKGYTIRMTSPSGTPFCYASAASTGVAPCAAG